MPIRPSIATILAGTMGALLVDAPRMPAEPSPGPPYYALLCSHCHGPDGEGRQDIGAPTLAGLPDWYVVAQLEKFRNGQRGTHPDDKEGALMRAIALSVNAEMQEAVLATIAGLKPKATTHESEAPDLDTGEFLYYAAECAACHRYNGSGELAFQSPPLTNLQDWYIERQLVKFAEGIRGYHPDDVGGVKMQPFARSVAGKKDLDDLLAFIAKLAKKYPPKQDEPAPPAEDSTTPEASPGTEPDTPSR